ncbi:MAG: hypothetical protein AAF561_03695 [Planctomycetota bacterium]
MAFVATTDASPIIGLARADCLHILPSMFARVLMPPAVLSELRQANQDDSARQFVETSPTWLEIIDAARPLHLPQLHDGEAAAISVAVEHATDFLLIDERDGRDIAIAHGLRVVRTAALLFEAANAGFLVDLESAFARLRASDFRVSTSVLDKLLSEYRRRLRGQPLP